MRLLALLLASTVLSAASTAAFADPDFVAGVNLGGTQWNGGFFYDDQPAGVAAQGLLSGTYDFTPQLGVQGDVLVQYEGLEGDLSDKFNVGRFDGALHGFYRESERFLLGGFVQLGRDTFEEDGHPEDALAVDRTLV